MRVLVACEFSGRVAQAFRDAGHDAWSADILRSEICLNPDHTSGAGDCCGHYIGDVLDLLTPDTWDLLIAHPPCTFLANSGVRWLYKQGTTERIPARWAAMQAGAAFYRALRDAPVPRKCIENPILHKHALGLIRPGHRQVVQPWWFGEPFFKATGFELFGLPDLVATNRLTPPKRGTAEHKAWSAVHRASPGPDRWKERSRTFEGIARAMAAQWGES